MDKNNKISRLPTMANDMIALKGPRIQIPQSSLSSSNQLKLSSQGSSVSMSSPFFLKNRQKSSSMNQSQQSSFKFKNPYGHAPITPIFVQDTANSAIIDNAHHGYHFNQKPHNKGSLVERKNDVKNGFSLLVTRLQKDIDLSKISESIIEKSVVTQRQNTNTQISPQSNDH